MPYIFVTDGNPEAEEYADNYIWYDAADPESYKAALGMARERDEDIRSSRFKEPSEVCFKKPQSAFREIANFATAAFQALLPQYS